MLPAGVSIRMLAWPVPVIRTAVPLLTRDPYPPTLPEAPPAVCGCSALPSNAHRRHLRNVHPARAPEADRPVRLPDGMPN
ncbi:hypothetical protein GCM10023322_17660 [Rugosimonospora acidiphila]|uniref:Secreted protein n=1 Tax=Rugosimonospora acidiphila TaxID=556531 RepID=A0ABP9RNY2_9ACTN